MSVPTGAGNYPAGVSDNHPYFTDETESDECADELNAAYNDGWNDAIEQVAKMANGFAASIRKLKVKQ